jgi:FixJ family two-component response regulator
MLGTDCHRPVAVIEDDEVSRHAIGRLLMAGGFESALFESAESFIAATPAPWLCLIVDVQLTGISGIDLQQRLRASGSALPIIVTTGARDDRIRERAEEGGCVAFLLKPYSPDAVLALLDSIAHPTDT